MVAGLQAQEPEYKLQNPEVSGYRGYRVLENTLLRRWRQAGAWGVQVSQPSLSELQNRKKPYPQIGCVVLEQPPRRGGGISSSLDSHCVDPDNLEQNPLQTHVHMSLEGKQSSLWGRFGGSFVTSATQPILTGTEYLNGYVLGSLLKYLTIEFI